MLRTKVLLFTIFAVTLSAFGLLVTTLFNSAPTHQALWYFYSSGFLTLFGIAFYVLYLIAYFKFNITPDNQSLFSSLRYAFLVGLVVMLIIAIRANNALNWPIAAVILVAIVIVGLLWRRQPGFKLKKQ